MSTVTLTMNTAIQYFQCTFWLMSYHQGSLVAKESLFHDAVETVLFWLCKSPATPPPPPPPPCFFFLFFLATLPHDDEPPLQVWLQNKNKKHQFRGYLLNKVWYTEGQMDGHDDTSTWTCVQVCSHLCLIGTSSNDNLWVDQSSITWWFCRSSAITLNTNMLSVS